MLGASPLATLELAARPEALTAQTLSASQAQSVGISRVVQRSVVLAQQGGQQKLGDPSFEASTLGNAPNAPWTQFLGGGCPAPTTWAVQNGWASDGTKSMRITTANQTLVGNALYLLVTNVAYVAVVPKALYRWSADFNVLTLPAGMVIRTMIEWHDASGTYISQSYSPAVTNPFTGVVSSYVEAVAPANAASGRTVVYISGTGVGDFYIDNTRFSYVPTLIRTANRIFAPSQSQAVALVRANLRTQAPTQAQAVAVVKTVSRAMALTQAQAANLAQATARILAATQSAGAVRSAQSSRTFAASQNAAVVVGRTAARSLSATQLAAVALARTAARSLSATQLAAVALARTAARSLSATQLAAVALARTAARSLSATQLAAVALTRTITGTLTAAQPASVTFASSSAMTLGAEQSQSPSITGTVSRAFVVSAASSATVKAALSTTRSVPQVAAVKLTRACSRTITVAQAADVSLVRLPITRSITLTASQSQASALAGVTWRYMRAAQAASASRSLTVSRRFASTQAQQARVQRALARGRAVTQNQVGVRFHPIISIVFATAAQTASVATPVGARTFAAAQSANATLAPATLTRTLLLGQRQVAILVLPLGPPSRVTTTDSASTRLLIGDAAVSAAELSDLATRALIGDSSACAAGISDRPTTILEGAAT